METIPLWQSSLVVFSVLFAARNVAEVTMSALRSDRRPDERRGQMSLAILVLGFLVSGGAAFMTLDVSVPMTGMSALGALLFLASYAVRLRTLRWMGERYSLFIEPCAPVMISDGPFRFIRHPIYLAYIGEMAAIWLMAPNVISAGALAIVALVSDLRSRHEELALVKAYGGSYVSYQQTTKRFIPFIY